MIKINSEYKNKIQKNKSTFKFINSKFEKFQKKKSQKYKKATQIEKKKN